MMLTGNAVTLWPTFMWWTDLEPDHEFDKAAVELANEATPREFLSNGARTNLFTEYAAHPVIRKLVNVAYLAARNLLEIYKYDDAFELIGMCDAWVHEKGGQVTAHNHARYDLVCLYYPRIDVDEHSNVGALRLYDPRGCHRFWDNRNPDHYDDESFVFWPKVGRVVIFPGCLVHDTAVYDGPGQRINYTMSLDVNTKTAHPLSPLAVIKEDL